MEIIPYRWQKDCLEAWISSGCHGIAHVVTGAGKTRLALLAIEYLRNHSERPVHTMIIVPNCALMEQWIRELKGVFHSTDIIRVGGGYRGNAEAAFQVMVINSARMLLPYRRNALLSSGNAVLLICDECHHYGAAENRKIFNGVSITEKNYYTLGLSATPQNEWFDSVLVPALGRIFYRYSHSEAIRDSIVAPFILEQVAVSFNAEEMEQYAIITGEIGEKLKELSDGKSNMSDLPPADFFQFLNRLRNDGDERAEIVFNLIQRRRELVMLTESRMNCTRSLIALLPGESRIIVFCERIAQADEIYTELTAQYPGQIGKTHSGRSAEQNRYDISRFRDGEIRILIACKGLDEGVDVPEADIAIVLSGTLMERQHIQRLGRILRRGTKKEKIGVLYYVYVKQSSEYRSYLQDSDCPVVNLNYSPVEGFSCMEYEDTAVCVLEMLKGKNADESQLSEARKCILGGIALADWKRPQEYCERKTAEAAACGDIHLENYWRCMNWMRMEDQSFGQG